MFTANPYPVAVQPGVTVSKKAWARLPKELQDVFDKTAKEYLWEGIYERWRSDCHEKNGEAELLIKGMKVLKHF